MAKNGKVAREEMYQVFNMGIGMVAIVGKKDASKVQGTLRARAIGRIERGTGRTRLIF